MEVADFCGAIRSGQPLCATAELARDVVMIVESADRSLRSGGTEVLLFPEAGLTTASVNGQSANGNGTRVVHGRAR
jgi:hypothetical protein